MRKINIYAPTYKQASDLAAKMNLALRHWEYAAAWQAGPDWTSISNFVMHSTAASARRPSSP